MAVGDDGMREKERKREEEEEEENEMAKTGHVVTEGWREEREKL